MKYIRQKEWLLIRIDEQYHLKTIEEFLDAYVISKAKQQQYIASKIILLNRRSVLAQTLMQKGDTLQIRAFTPKAVDVIPSETEAEVVYEDDFMLIVNKPSGILVHDDSASEAETLDQQVAAYYIAHGIETTVRHVHRLDRETSGLVIYSKTEFFQPKLDRMLFHHEIHRSYYAFVEGTFDRESGTIDAPIGRDRHVSGKYRVSKETGKRAITHYRVARRQKRFTLLEVKLETGRTHQIRVHMAYIGHPIVNDVIYGEPYDRLPMGLQAYKIEMPHLLDDSMIRVCIPCAF